MPTFLMYFNQSQQDLSHEIETDYSQAQQSPNEVEVAASLCIYTT